MSVGIPQATSIFSIPRLVSETVPYKQYKITEEDYRNRAKWPQYEIAVHDMVQQTSGQQAPWTLVEANDKYFARIKVLRTICDRLHAATKRELANVNQSW